MADPQRPILPLPRAEPADYRKPGRGGAGGAWKKADVKARVGPRFAELRDAVAGRRLELKETALGVSPELVLVIEINKGGTSDFFAALQSTELAFLVGADDDGEFDEDESADDGTTRLFLVMANHRAIGQLVALWRLWSTRKRPMLGAQSPWAKAFRFLRDIRLWGSQDRLHETGLLREWQTRLAEPHTEWVPLEIELWFRTGPGRDEAVARVTRLVEAAGGEVKDRSTIDAIGYHGILANMPIGAVGQLLNDPNVGLVKSDDVHLLRPVAQQPFLGDSGLGEVLPSRDPTTRVGLPTLALLDGLPLENHALLRGRLIVDDPEDWTGRYGTRPRRHGTAMASLILHGDLGASGTPATRPIYVRPILRPAEFGHHLEEAPRDRLWIDVIRVAIEGLADAAPTVRIVNLSVGDQYRPFVREMSPLARLLDWLAWTRRLLFIVSAGNHTGPLFVDAGDALLDQRALHALKLEHRHRRLLSPAESINSVTVGAQNSDAAGPWEQRGANEVELMTSNTLANPISGLGRGHRRAVKPDLLAPGGRVVFVRDLKDPRVHTPSLDRARIGPGQRAAGSGGPGVLDAEDHSFGTSNAAALVSRAAMQILDVVNEVGVSSEGSLARVPEALMVKCMLVHTSTWDRAAFELLESAIKDEHNSNRFRDHAAAFLGYGNLRADRATECEGHRATLIGGGEVMLESAVQHRVPLPASLNAYTGVRRVVVTLAWFSPIKVSHRNYRVAGLAAVVSRAQQDALGLTGADVDGSAAKRGTVQHVVFSSSGRTAARVGVDDELVITVTASPDAGTETGTAIPYALAVTIDVEANNPIPIYQEVAARIRTQVRVG